MKQLYLILILLIVNLHYSNAQPANYFIGGDEGWTAQGEGVGIDPVSGWIAINGNPTGCFKSTDNANGTWYFNSSAAYNTDLSAFYGDNLCFDLKQNANTFQTNEPDVMICKSDGSRIVYSTPVNPGTIWTSYTVPLIETGWKYNTLAGLPVSYIDMVAFLTNTYVIKIRGDYSTITTETNWLDNVYISAALLLPITLIDFTGTQVNTTASELEWTTLSETDCNYFQVEKSVNGGINFDSIGYHRAVGNAHQITNYSFFDKMYVSSAYYRLKSVDFDNSKFYSEIIYVASTIPAVEVTIYPNPSNGIIHINCIQNFEPESIILVHDIQSKLVYTGSITNTNNTVVLPLAFLKNGMYFISIYSTNSMHTYPVQIIH
jgi:hypothetical protein